MESFLEFNLNQIYKKKHHTGRLDPWICFVTVS